MNSKYIDLSLTKNQNSVALLMSKIFNIKELEELFQLKNNIFYNSKKRDISKSFNIILTKEFSGDKNIKLIDVFLLDTYPVARYINFNITNRSHYNIDLNFKYTKNIRQYIIITLSKAINLCLYESSNIIKYNKNNIVNNFSKQLSLDISKKGLQELGFIIEFNKDKIINLNNDSFNFNIENINFSIISEAEIIKFQYTKNDVDKYIFLLKDKINISHISIIIQKSISYLNN